MGEIKQSCAIGYTGRNEEIMTIEKNGKTYTVTESRDKWTVKTNNGKLSIAFDISKKLCSKTTELIDYVLNNNELF